jgi:hypothetical protein
MREMEDKREDQRMEELLTGLRDEYNAPPETPREEMWDAIQARLGTEDENLVSDEKVVSLDAVRQSRMARYRKPMGWAVAAAAVLVLGLGIGRMTAPGGAPAVQVAAESASSSNALQVAALEHLVQTESLLTLVRADVRAGRVEPAMATWARSLLNQTRLLMDAQGDADPVMKELLEDLELVLVQMVGAANAAPEDGDRVRSEWNLALEGLEKREVLPRIQAVIPAGPRLVGT